METSRVTYRDLNAEINLWSADGKIQFEKDKQAVKAYFLEHVNMNTVFFHSLREKLDYLVREGYYEQEFLDNYSFKFIKSLYQRVYDVKFRFQTYMGAEKFYTSYALKTNDGTRFLERYEDRIAATALYLAQGNARRATALADEMITQRFQPATPTFLNAGKAQRGELVSCFLINVEDDLNSIMRMVNSAGQLSKRGGGVAFNMTDIRAHGDPIKNKHNQSGGVVPWLKILDVTFTAANQLGQRPGAGAVYLNAHHMDILKFLDTKKVNADDNVRLKTLSLGVIMPDITYELVANDEYMCLFSPYDVAKKYGKAFSEVNMSEVYRELEADEGVRREVVKAREFMQRLAEVQCESGYPYIMFEDNVNRANPIAGKVKMSNLCTEILQVSTPNVVNDKQEYEVLGKDISCNLGSLNIASVMDGPDFGKTVNTAIRALTTVSDMSDLDCAPSIQKGNAESHAIGLGAMNLHGFFGREGIDYDSEEARDFTNMYFYCVAYHAILTSSKIAKERGESFVGFENSTYASGEFFDKYIEQEWKPRTKKVARLFKNIHIPVPDDWRKAYAHVKKHGMYNQNLQAVAPTGSISYVNYATASIHPITAKIEPRKDGSIGMIYYPAAYMTNENHHLYRDAYEIGWKALIDLYAEAQQHVDQGLSLTLYFTEEHEAKELFLAQKYAWEKGIKTLYYNRLRSMVIEGTDMEGCVSCAV